MPEAKNVFSYRGSAIEQAVREATALARQRKRIDDALGKGVEPLMAVAKVGKTAAKRKRGK